MERFHSNVFVYNFPCLDIFIGHGNPWKLNTKCLLEACPTHKNFVTKIFQVMASCRHLWIKFVVGCGLAWFLVYWLQYMYFDSLTKWSLTYAVGEVFVRLSAEDTQQRLEEAKQTMLKHLSKLRERAEETEELIKKTKSELYAKFGDNINLEADR